MLLDRMGEEGMDIFESWNEEVEDLQYDEMKERFENHFMGKENIIATRHRFLSIEMEAGETMDKYVERVDGCSRSCRFGGIREDMVVQMVIKGMKEDKLRKELLLKKGLNLAKLRELRAQFESAMAASKIISKGSVLEVEVIDRAQESQVNWMNSYRSRGRGAGNRRGRGRGATTGTTCYSCGGSGHFARNCPSQQNKAKETTRGECYNFREEGRFARECPKLRSKTGQYKKKGMHQVEEGGQSDTSDSSL